MNGFNFYRVSLVLAMAILLKTPMAFSWADLGHSVVGAVAEQTMEPATKNFVRGILGVEPVGTAAVWPDHVRDDARFADTSVDDHNFNDYHFCEIPTGYTYDTRPNKDVKDCYGVITHSIELLKDTTGKFSQAEKLIALRYLIHVVGDIHQPLHVGNDYDLGGNACLVRWLGQPASRTFHSLWDNEIVNYLGVTYNPTRPAIYMSDYMKYLNTNHPEMFTAAAKQQYGAGDVKSWLQESADIRESDGFYPDDPATMAGVPATEKYKHRAYCSWYSNQTTSTLGAGSPNPKSVPVAQLPNLDDTYAKKFAAIAESQLLKAGLRLAATLDAIAQSVAASQAQVPLMTDDQQETVLKNIQAIFRNDVAPVNQCRVR